MVECPPRVQEVAGLIPGQVIQNTFNMVVMGALTVAGLADWLAGVRIIEPEVLVIYQEM